jgi:anti-anti-sigma regulatory factor
VALRDPGGETSGDDRCGYPRPFLAGFTACPTFQAVGFIAADSMNQPLGERVTCRHLTTGKGTAGRFYPRCALGSASQRLRWLMAVTPARLEVMRVLQEEFDQHTLPQRSELFRAKAAAAEAPQDRHLAEQLQTMVQAFITDASAFLAEREQRYREVGLSVSDLVVLLRQWSDAWLRSRRLTGAQLHGDAGAALALDGAAGGTLQVMPSADASLSQLVLEEAHLRIHRTTEPAGLRIEGEVDAVNSGALSDALLAATKGEGDGDLHLDLSGVLFCDLAGIRAMVRAAESIGPARRLVVSGMPAQMDRAMRLVGWAQLPNLVVVPGENDAASGNVGY